MDGRSGLCEAPTKAMVRDCVKMSRNVASEFCQGAGVAVVEVLMAARLLVLLVASKVEAARRGEAREEQVQHGNEIKKDFPKRRMKNEQIRQTRDSSSHC